MTNVKGNAEDFLKATTTDPDLPVFDAEEVNSQIGSARVFTGWAKLPKYPDERRNLAFRLQDTGNITNKTYDLGLADSGATVSWWEGTSGSDDAPFTTRSGSLTITVNASTDAGNAAFKFSAISSKGKTVEAEGSFNITLRDEGSAKP